MDEIENFSEKIHERSNERAHHMLEAGIERRILFAALSTAFTAVMVAITGLLAGDHADKAMLFQNHASERCNSGYFYCCKATSLTVGSYGFACMVFIFNPGAFVLN